MKKGSASIAFNCLTYNTRIVRVFSYVSQLVPLPKTFHELFGMCSATRAPNAIYERVYLFSDGPKFRFISASCAAALFRTSFSWLKGITQLEACAKECMPVELCGKDHISYVLGYRAPGPQP